MSIAPKQRKKDSLKMKERRRNAYENKGPDLQSLEQSRNVAENKELTILKRECC
jgi:hypothetical protein